MGSNIQTANSTALADNDALSGQAFQDPEPATPVRKAKRASGFLGLLRQNRKASLGAGIIVFFLTMAIIGPWVAPYDPTEIVGRRHEAPSSEFWFGTDGSEIGRASCRERVES